MNKQNEREPLWLLALFLFAALVGVAPIFLAACAAEKRHNSTPEQVNMEKEVRVWMERLEKPL